MLSLRKIFGLLLFLVGVVILAADLTTYFDSGLIELTLIGDLWFEYSASTLNLLQAVLERYIWPPLWDPVVTTFLLWPASLVAIIIGALTAGVKSPV